MHARTFVCLADEMDESRRDQDARPSPAHKHHEDVHRGLGRGVDAFARPLEDEAEDDPDEGRHDDGEEADDLQALRRRARGGWVGVCQWRGGGGRDVTRTCAHAVRTRSYGESGSSGPPTGSTVPSCNPRSLILRNRSTLTKSPVCACACACARGSTAKKRESGKVSPPPPGLMRRALIIPDVIFRPQTRTMS